MKRFSFENFNSKFFAALYICQQTKFRPTSSKIRYHYKKLKSHKCLQEKIKQARKIDQLHTNSHHWSDIENKFSINIWIYNASKLIRQSKSFFTNDLNIFSNDRDLRNLELIYEFCNSGGPIKVQTATIFQALSAHLCTDFRNLENKWSEKYDLDNINLSNDSNFVSLWNIGLNIDTWDPKTVIHRTANKLHINIRIKNRIINGRDLILITEKPSIRTCKNSGNCLMSNTNNNLSSHENVCSPTTAVTYKHQKYGKKSNITDILIREGYFDPCESYKTNFIFVNIFQCVNPHNNEIYIRQVSIHSNIDNKTFSISGPDWVDQFCKYISEQLVLYNNILKCDKNRKRKIKIENIKAQPINNFIFAKNDNEKSAVDKFFLKWCQLKFMVNDLDLLAENITKIQPLFQSDKFFIQKKGTTTIYFENRFVAFYHFTAFLLEKQDISVLVKMWLNENICRLPNSCLIDPKSRVSHIPEPFNDIDKENVVENQLEFLSSGWNNFDNYVIQRNNIICEKFFQVVVVMASYYRDVFNIDIFQFRTISAISFNALFAMYKTDCQPFHTFSEKYRFYADQIRHYSWGGLNFLFKRHLTCEKGYPDAAHLTASGECINDIISFDINSQYVSAYLSDLPTGIPVIFEKRDDFFVPTITIKPDNFSRESLIWLEYEQQKLEVQGISAKIQPAMSGGEQIVSGKKVDGYTKIGTQELIYEFFGCKWHSHKKCFPPESLDPEEKLEQEYINHTDDLRLEELASAGKLIMIWECDWARIKRNIKFSPKSLYLKQKISLDDLLGSKFFGFIHCHLSIPQHLVDKYSWQGLSLLFNKKGGFVRPSKDTTILIFSPFLQWYLLMGIEISEISYAIYYHRGAPFSDFAHKLENLRKSAYNDKNTVLSEVVKLIGNASVGRLGLRSDKMTKTEYKTPQNIKKYTYARLEDMAYTDGMVMLTRKYKAREIISLNHVYLAILQLSKLDLLKKIFGLCDVARPGSFSLAYIDTDSFTIGYNNNNMGLAALVKPEMVDKWEEFYENNFVTDKKHPKTLGLLKIENQIRSGHFLATGCKQYLFTDGTKEKMAVAGFSAKLSLSDFIRSVYESQHTTVLETRRVTANNATYLKKMSMGALAGIYKKGVIAKNMVDINHD